MPVPSSMADLSATAGGNSPQGTETATGVVDDYLRSGFAILRATESYRTGVASASTVSLATYPEKYIQITGTTSISSFGSASSGQTRVLRFTGALTLVNSSSLILPRGADLTTAPGDIAHVFYDGSAWVVTDFFPYTGADGAVVTWTGSTTTTPDIGSILASPSSGVLLGSSGTVSIVRSTNGAWSGGAYTAIRSGAHLYTISVAAGDGASSFGDVLIYPYINDVYQSLYGARIKSDGWPTSISHQIYLTAGQTLKFRAWSTAAPRAALPNGSIAITYQGA